MSTRGKTTPASTPGSYAAKAGVPSRVTVPGWDQALLAAMSDVAVGCETPEAAQAVLNGALAVYSMECDECAQPMWIDGDGVAFHAGRGPDGVAHDLDADHVSYCAEVDNFDDDNQTHVALLAAVTDICDGYPQHAGEIRDVCRSMLAERFATVIAERRERLVAAVLRYQELVAPRRWGRSYSHIVDGPSKHVVARWKNDAVVAVVTDDFGTPGDIREDTYEQIIADTTYVNGDPDQIVVYGCRYFYQTDGVRFRHLTADGRIFD